MSVNKNNSSVQYGVIVFLIIGLIVYLYSSTLVDLFEVWNTREEYSHGVLIPFVVGYLIWQRYYTLRAAPIVPSWWGCGLLGVSFLIYLIGISADISFLMRVSLIITLYGLLLALFGEQWFKTLFVPIFLLFFCIPLPPALQASLTAQLQLISSQLGVSFIRFCNIPVYLEGNVIDLGSYQLQVVEACSGLRYLFPLMSLSFICAYMYQVVIWKRLIVFFSSIPITVLMNSFRIGVIAVLVENWGVEMAEGFMHDFEGWLVFMVCFLLLLIEMWLLSSRERKKQSWWEIIGGYEGGQLTIQNSTDWSSIISKQAVTVICTLIVMISLQANISNRDEIIPIRKQYGELSLNVDGYKAMPQSLSQDIVKFLELTDYILIDYVSSNKIVNFYVAYYESQKKGRVPHSPKLCIPGGGWEIIQLTEEVIDDTKLNRVLIKKDQKEQLVYYWYQHRDKSIANEFLLKWNNFLSAIKDRRTDVALVRLTTFVDADEKLSDAENRLRLFKKNVKSQIEQFVPL